MDFETLKKRINKGKYDTYEGLLKDLMLIWDNCKLYNMRKSEIYKLSDRMEKMTRREIEKFKVQYNLTDMVYPNKPQKIIKKVEQKYE